MPKETGVRPIVNLARKPVAKVCTPCRCTIHGKLVNSRGPTEGILAQSTRSCKPRSRCSPLNGLDTFYDFHMICLALAGSSPGSTRRSNFEPQRRLREVEGIQTAACQRGWQIVRTLLPICDYADNRFRPRLYFVKMDVRACFDTIEQGKLLEILRKVIEEVSIPFSLRLSLMDCRTRILFNALPA